MTHEIQVIVLPHSSLVNPKFRCGKRKFEDYAQDFKTFLKKYVRTTKIHWKTKKWKA
jgi:hypothetical protein